MKSDQSTPIAAVAYLLFTYVRSIASLPDCNICGTEIQTHFVAAEG